MVVRARRITASSRTAEPHWPTPSRKPKPNRKIRVRVTRPSWIYACQGQGLLFPDSALHRLSPQGSVPRPTPPLLSLFWVRCSLSRLPIHVPRATLVSFFPLSPDLVLPRFLVRRGHLGNQEVSLVPPGPQPGSDWLGCYPFLTFSGVLPFLMTRNAKRSEPHLPVVCSRKVAPCETPAWCWVLVWRRNIREGFPEEVTVE